MFFSKWWKKMIRRISNILFVDMKECGIIINAEDRFVRQIYELIRMINESQD